MHSLILSYELSSNANSVMVCATLIMTPNMFASIDVTCGYKWLSWFTLGTLRVFTTTGSHLKKDFYCACEVISFWQWPNSYEYEEMFLFTLLFLDDIEM